MHPKDSTTVIGTPDRTADLNATKPPHTTAEDEWASINTGNADAPFSEAKLVKPAPTGNPKLDAELTKAWADHIKLGFNHNQEMFRKVLTSFMGPYETTVRLYKLVFGIGIGLFVAAALLSLITREALFGLIFGGLGLGVVLSFFISQPLRALEQNLQFIAWLGVSYNNYWTRLMHVQDSATALEDIKSAGEDFNKGMLELVQTHAEISSKRPGSDIS